MKALVILILLITSSVQAACRDCVALRGVVANVRIEMKKPSPNYGPLVQKATAISEGLPDVLTKEQLSAYVECLRAFHAVDPTNAYIENTIVLVEKNKAAIDAALLNIPKPEAHDLGEALKLALEAEAHGQS